MFSVSPRSPFEGDALVRSELTPRRRPGQYDLIDEKRLAHALDAERHRTQEHLDQLTREFAMRDAELSALIVAHRDYAREQTATLLGLLYELTRRTDPWHVRLWRRLGPSLADWRATLGERLAGALSVFV